jgi:hypothetical protein
MFDEVSICSVDALLTMTVWGGVGRWRFSGHSTHLTILILALVSTE